MSFDLYLIRHGQSENNALPESQRVEDPGLTPLGRDQAQRLAHDFPGSRPTHLLTSGFLRALQTSISLSRRFNLMPTVWIGLHEVGGCYAGYEDGREIGRPGMNHLEIRERFPDWHLPEELDELGWWKSQPYESWEQARVRARQQANRLVAEFAMTDAKVACVIHADFKAILLETLLSKAERSFSPNELHNTGTTTLRFEDERFRLVDFNSNQHLQM